MALRSPLTPARLTPEQFEAVAALPENRERRVEYVLGELVEMVSNDRSSALALALGSALYTYLQQHPIGWMTGADGGYVLGNSRVIPDAAVILFSRRTGPVEQAWSTSGLDLAVEVLSPSDRTSDVAAKLRIYAQAGVLVWLVDPEDKSLTVLPPAGLPTVLHADDTLDGGDVLPGFRLPLRALFPEN